MPLIKSGSKQAVSTNIREMVAAGHPRAQAIAAALSTARRYGKADGGEVSRLKGDLRTTNFPTIDKHELSGSYKLNNDYDLIGKAHILPEPSHRGIPTLTPETNWGASIGIRKNFADGGDTGDLEPELADDAYSAAAARIRRKYAPAAEERPTRLKALGEGMIQGIQTPGALMKQNPYPAGSEEADFYDTQNKEIANQWGPSMALGMVGGSTPFRPAKTLGSGMGKPASWEHAVNDADFADAFPQFSKPATQEGPKTFLSEPEAGRPSDLELGKAEFQKYKAELGVKDGLKEIQNYADSQPPFSHNHELDPHNFDINPTIKKVGDQLGSNPGGTYNLWGLNHYIKEAKSVDHALNEVLTNKLYHAADVNVPDIDYGTMGGKPVTASSMIEGVKPLSHLKEIPGFDAKKFDGLHNNFVVDAWLGNRDVVGDDFSNIVGHKYGLYRIDQGGGLRYRAQGEPKTDFGPKVTELETMRDKKYAAGQIFHDITDESIIKGAKRVAKISTNKIKTLVDKYGPVDPVERAKLAETLLGRQQHIIQYATKLEEKNAPKKAIQKAGTKAALNIATTTDDFVFHHPNTYPIEEAGNAAVKGYGDNAQKIQERWDAKAPKLAESWRKIQEARNPFTDNTYHGTFEWRGEYPDSSRFYSATDPDMAGSYVGISGTGLKPHHTINSIQNGTAPQILPLKINPRDYHVYDAKGGEWGDHNHKAIADAEKQGKKGVIVKNVIDYMSSNSGQKPADVYISFDPKNNPTIKSRFAKFDPSKWHLPELLASGAAMIAAPGSFDQLMGKDMKNDQVAKTARKYAGGGDVPWFARQAAKSTSHFGAGYLSSSVPGRTDKLPISVPSGAYVVPADIVSSMGQGNSNAGAQILSKMFTTGPLGIGGRSSGPKIGMASRLKAGRPGKGGKSSFADGGATPPVDIIAAGGEYVIPWKLSIILATEIWIWAIESSTHLSPICVPRPLKPSRSSPAR